MTRNNNFTTGQIYDSILQKERTGEFLGTTVQIIPHVTDEIKRVIRLAENNYDIIVVEIGGTVGDIESLPFLEALRQLSTDLPYRDSVLVHLTYLPFVATAGEIKTKPTQHSVRDLRSTGLQPDFLLCRTVKECSQAEIAKISLFTNVEKSAVIPVPDADSIYEIPELIHKYKFDEEIIKKLAISDAKAADLSSWQQLNKKRKDASSNIKIAIVGKYTTNIDSYKSLDEALTHSAIHNNSQLEIVYLDSDKVKTDSNTLKELCCHTDTWRFWRTRY